MKNYPQNQTVLDFDFQAPGTMEGLGMHSSWRVLLVEEIDGDAELVTQLLQDTAATDEIVLERAVCAADAVLLDLSLPDSRGLETFTRVRNADRHVAIVVLTGFTDQKVVWEVIDAGAQDYLVENQLDSKHLARVLRYAIQRQRTLSELFLH